MTDRERYFVTGGAGFIGSHLVDRLLAEGYEVTAYDKLALGRSEWLERVLRNSRFSLAQADMLDLDALTSAMGGHEVVCHLGANTDIPGGAANPQLDLKNCTIATSNVLEAMAASGIRKLIFASSAAVYGETPVRPTPEDVGPLLPISPYGAAKLACEGLISAYCHLHAIQAWMFRFANVVGGRMGHGVIFDFVRKLQKDPHVLEILGDGEQKKNFFLVDDCVDGMLFAFRHAQEPCGVFNLGSESSLRVTDVARITVEEMGLSDTEFRYTGGQRGWPGDVPIYVHDVSKMRGLGWAAKHSAVEAVRIAVKRLTAEGEPVRV
jgi:UDP-glucose 4-epimerase